MDGITTDGPHGRALLQVVRELPIGHDPVFDRYRAAVAIDYGEWDVLATALRAAPVESAEIERFREILLAPGGAPVTPPSRSSEASPFGGYEYMLAALPGWYRRWVRHLPSWDAKTRWSRPDVPAGRHFRFRQLHHDVLLACAEAEGGRLEIAVALAEASRRFGDRGEPLLDIGHDVGLVCAFAMGDEPRADLRLFERTGRPDGMSPLGTLEWLFHLMPFLFLYRDDSAMHAARLASRIASRLALPRAQLQSEAWLVAAESRETARTRAKLAAVAAQSRRAGPGLRLLPELLRAVATRRYSDLLDAESLARRVGNTWAQVCLLTHLVALDPSPRASKSLLRVLIVTGWRRPILIEADVVAEAAIGLTARGLRHRAILELALATGRTTAAVEVAARHAEDLSVDAGTRDSALEALARIGTTHARAVLEAIAKRGRSGADVARQFLSRAPRTAGLTEREVEVIGLAGRGMTNRQIGDALSLSPHTVARHLANARDKLGAANRTDAAVRLGRLTDSR